MREFSVRSLTWQDYNINMFSKIKFHLRDDFFNEETQSFLTTGEKVYTVGEEKSKFETNESNSHSPRLAHRGLLEGLILPLHFRRDFKTGIKEVGKSSPNK